MEVPHLCDDPLGMKNSHRPDPKHDVHLTEAAYSLLKATSRSREWEGGILYIRDRGFSAIRGKELFSNLWRKHQQLPERLFPRVKEQWIGKTKADV